MKYLYVANWKMNLSFDQSISFCKNNHDALQQIPNNVAEIVICPSFVAIAPIAEIFKNSPIAIGAQDCSEHSLGAYTGETSALSLAEVGVTYCIVGHSERRMYYGETTETIIKKIYLLYATNIMPIICIGETHEDFANKKTFNVLTEQLSPILAAIAQQQEKRKEIIIAYEPVWAIGTGIVPTLEQLTTVFEWITKQIALQLSGYTIHLLYGGSVNQSNIAELKKTPPINGFLIGGASTDFEQFKKIITL
jgi:triosephosphate isomerase (TIM)